MSDHHSHESSAQQRQWIDSLKEGERVDEVYLVWRKNKLLARNGRSYLALQIGDRTGRLDARAWDRADELDVRFEVHDLVRVEGQVVRFQDHLQIKVQDIVSLRKEGGADSLGDMAAFLPSSSRSVEQMWSELLGLVEGLSDADLRGLLQELLRDADIAERFQAAPAAKSIHHAWRGGLLEHTLSVCGLVQAVWRHYEGLLPGLLDRSLLVAGAILHDLGKVYEMDPVTFEYTDEGRLLGHMSLMLVELDRRIRARTGFPKSLALHLEHMLLSHHGELEYGSPKRPKTPEAWVLHYADILDGRMMWIHSLFGDLNPGEWSTYQRLYDRYFWKPAGKGDRASMDEGQSTMRAPGSMNDAEGGAAERLVTTVSATEVAQTAGGRQTETVGDGGLQETAGEGRERNPGQAVLPLLPGLDRRAKKEDPEGVGG